MQCKAHSQISEKHSQISEKFTLREVRSKMVMKIYQIQTTQKSSEKQTLIPWKCSATRFCKSIQDKIIRNAQLRSKSVTENCYVL